MGPSTKRWLKRGALGIAILAVMSVAVGVLSDRTQKKAFSNTGQYVAGGGTETHAVVAGPISAAAPQAVPGSGTAGAADVQPAEDQSGLPPLNDGIARTADISVEVKKGKFDQGWAAIFRLAERYGGQILSSSRGTSQPVPLDKAESSRSPASGEITMRVPASRFAAATNALRELGIVRADNSSTEDVTQEYVDLQSRLRNLRAERDVLLSLFRRANSIGDTLAVQRRLSDVEGDIEKITGRVNYLDTRTAFSTITLRLAEPGAAFNTEAATGPSFSAAWDTAREGLVRIAGASMILTLWLTPFAVLALIGLSIWRRTRGPAPQV